MTGTGGCAFLGAAKVLVKPFPAAVLIAPINELLPGDA